MAIVCTNLHAEPERRKVDGVFVTVAERTTCQVVYSDVNLSGEPRRGLKDKALLVVLARQ